MQIAEISARLIAQSQIAGLSSAWKIFQHVLQHRGYDARTKCPPVLCVTTDLSFDPFESSQVPVQHLGDYIDVHAPCHRGNIAMLSNALPAALAPEANLARAKSTQITLWHRPSSPFFCSWVSRPQGSSTHRSTHDPLNHLPIHASSIPLFIISNLLSSFVASCIPVNMPPHPPSIPC